MPPSKKVKVVKVVKVEEDETPDPMLRSWDHFTQHRSHATGLVDYGMWVRLFQVMPPAPDEPFRRGLIWS